MESNKQESMMIIIAEALTDIYGCDMTLLMDNKKFQMNEFSSTNKGTICKFNLIAKKDKKFLDDFTYAFLSYKEDIKKVLNIDKVSPDIHYESGSIVIDFTEK